MHGFTPGRIANAAPPLLPVTRVIVVIVLASVLAACGGQTPTAPTTSTQAPVASQPNPDSLVVFREPSTGFSTSDLRDASGRIIQLTTGGDLIWTPSGARVSGYVIDSGHWAPPTYFIGLQTGVCGEFCAFSVRFGTEDGQRGAYLTVDYGHNNPGTLVNVEIVGDSIVVTQTSRVPPGTPTLSASCRRSSMISVAVLGARLGRMGQWTIGNRQGCRELGNWELGIWNEWTGNAKKILTGQDGMILMSLSP